MRRKTWQRIRRVEGTQEGLRQRVVVLERRLVRRGVELPNVPISVLEKRVRQLECSHERVKFSESDRSLNVLSSAIEAALVPKEAACAAEFMVLWRGWQTCRDCGKTLVFYGIGPEHTRTDYLEARLAHAKENHATEVAAIEAELAKARGRLLIDTTAARRGE